LETAAAAAAAAEARNSRDREGEATRTHLLSRGRANRGLVSLVEELRIIAVIYISYWFYLLGLLVL
jgi:hypothetical protein